MYYQVIVIPMMMECLNDDALMEIFVKLPPMSLFRFKSVSPEWRDLISSSTFLRHYAAAHRRSTGGGLVAFFQREGVEDTEDPMAAWRCNTLPICNKLGNYMHVPEHVGLFVDSSNGLILCRRGRSNVTYHVGNPLTGKFVKLPQPPQGKGLLEIPGQSNSGAHDTTRPEVIATALICEETTCNLEPVYTVLRAGLYGWRIGEQAKRIHIDSYSSKTGEWSPVTELVSAGRRIELEYTPPVVANGIVHWYTTNGIVVYDPNNGDRLVQPIHTPYNNKYEAAAVTRSADDDSVLWLAVLLGKKLLFYALPKDVEANYKSGGGAEIHAKEWKLMEEASTSISSISRLMKKGLVACKETTIECLIPESRSEVVVVLRQEKNVFFYNVHKKSIQKLEYSGSYNQRRELRPYFYSYVLPSYCL